MFELRDDFRAASAALSPPKELSIAWAFSRSMDAFSNSLDTVKRAACSLQIMNMFFLAVRSNDSSCRT